jgi:Tfp pilus assembly protein PilW
MMRKNVNKEGFTIVELLMATLATSIMAMAIGSILVFAWMGWARQSESVEMQRDVSMAMRIMAKEIRQATSVTTGTSLSCTKPGSDVVVFSQSGRDLNMQVNADAPMVIVRDVATSFSSEVNGVRSVRVLLALDTGTDNSNVGMVISRRN